MVDLCTRTHADQTFDYRRHGHKFPCFLPSNMLTLNEISLFFFSFILSLLNDNKPGPSKKHKTPVLQWLDAVPSTALPSSRTVRSSFLSSTCVSSLTIGLTHSTTTYVLMQGIRVTQQKSASPLPKAEPIRSFIEVEEQGAISDCDETQGRE